MLGSFYFVAKSTEGGEGASDEGSFLISPRTSAYLIIVRGIPVTRVSMGVKFMTEVTSMVRGTCVKEITNIRYALVHCLPFLFRTSGNLTAKQDWRPAPPPLVGMSSSLPDICCLFCFPSTPNLVLREVATQNLPI